MAGGARCVARYRPPRRHELRWILWKAGHHMKPLQGRNKSATPSSRGKAPTMIISIQAPSQSGHCNSVTRPSLNRSFIIRYAVSFSRLTSTTPFLYTESAGNVSQTSFGPDSIPRTWKSRDSRARAVDARSTFLITDIILKKLYSRDLDFFERSRMFYE